MEATRHWRLKKQRYSLVGKECANCNVKIFPPRPICLNCHTETTINLQESTKGEIYLATSWSKEASNSSK